MIAEVVQRAMQIKSEVRPPERAALMNRIAKSMGALNTETDALHFAELMVPLSVALKYIDTSAENYSVVDENTLDPTYFIAAYFDTRNMVEALWVYRIVRSLTRCILLSDKFYETGMDRYALQAKQMIQSTFRDLRSKHNHVLADSIDYWLAQFSAYWNFEQTIKRHIMENYTFSYAEIRHYNMSKSSDAPLIYAKVLDAKLPTFNENVTLILHYNQALLDILDDWEDIEEDVREGMPNIFVMAAVDSISYDKIRKTRLGSTRALILSETRSAESIRRLINDYQAAIKGISLPENFKFLKYLSARYGDSLTEKISTVSIS
jgi:hypothetical protein